MKEKKIVEEPKIQYKYFTIIGKEKIYIDKDIAERYNLEDTKIMPWTKNQIYKEVDSEG